MEARLIKQERQLYAEMMKWVVGRAIFCYLKAMWPVNDVPDF